MAHSNSSVDKRLPGPWMKCQGGQIRFFVMLRLKKKTKQNPVFGTKNNILENNVFGSVS